MKSWWPKRAQGRQRRAAGARSKPRPSGVEQALRRLEWTVIRRLDGLLQGDYRTLMRGTGLDLADLREYQHHDDVRHIDWNVTARLQTPHVRVFTEDREMAAWFVLDLSRSVDFGSGVKAKREISAGFVGVHRAPAHAARQPGRRAGLRQRRRSRDSAAQRPAPCAAPAACDGKRAARPSARPTQKGMTRLADLLKSAAVLMPRRSTVFVVSDFVERARLGARAGASWCSATTWSPCACSTRSSSNCPTSAWCRCAMPRPASSCGSTPTTRAFASASRASRPSAKPPCAKRWPRPASTRSNSRPQDDLVEAIVRFADMRKRRVAAADPSNCKLVARMNFLWPQFLWLLLALPLLVLLYLWLIRRKKKLALRFASLSIVREAMGAGQSVRRHIPPLLFLLALAAMLIAAARPMAVVVLPSNQQTIILGDGRVGQHARGRRAAQPAGGGAGGGQELPRRSCRAP